MFAHSKLINQIVQYIVIYCICNTIHCICQKNKAENLVSICEMSC